MNGGGMKDIQASWQRYGASFGDLEEDDIEANGIWDEQAFGAVLEDARTATIAVEGAVVPLLTPADNLPWVNRGWYDTLTDESSKPRVYHYSHLARLMDAMPAEYEAALAPALRAVAAEGGIVAYEVSEARAGRTDADFRALVGRIGGIACQDLGAAVAVQPVHYHYEGLPRSLQEIDVSDPRPLNFYGLYEAARADGSLPADHPISVEATLSTGDIARVWEYYEPAHRELNTDDPVNAGFTKEELEDVLTTPEFVKLVHRVDGRIVHLSLVADARACPWLNQRRFHELYPAAYDGGRIICGIGAITDPAAPPSVAPTVRAFAMIARLVARSGHRDVVLPYATDNHSNVYMPTLTQRAMRSYLDVDMLHPIARRVFRAVRLLPAQS